MRMSVGVPVVMGMTVGVPFLRVGMRVGMHQSVFYVEARTGAALGLARLLEG